MATVGATNSQARKLEVGHVLFMDVVGYSRLLIEDQRRTIDELQKMIRGLEEFKAADKETRLIRLPTGDGMALVFFGDPEAPLRASVELGRVLRDHPSLRLRMGIHSGPVYRVEDINANMNVAGGGVNLAQRVMDCGDAGHILVSEDTARFFSQVSEWADRLHDVGRTRAKHGVRLHLYSLYVSEVGNPRLPGKLRRERLRRRTVATAALAGLAMGVLVLLWKVLRPVPPPPPPMPTQITTYSSKSALSTAAISPDGRYLAYVNPIGIFVRDMQSGEAKKLPTPEGATLASPNWALGWFPNSTELAVTGPTGGEMLESLWLFHPFIGPAPARIAEKAWSPSVGPDGQVAFIDAETQSRIWTVGPQGGNLTKLAEAPKGTSFESICWSPLGGRLAFLELAQDPEKDFIGTVGPRGGQTVVLPGKGLVSGPGEEFLGLTWLPDGRIAFVRSNTPGPRGSGLWTITVDPRTGQPIGGAKRVTNEVGTYLSDLSSTSDGKHVAFLRTEFHFKVYLGHLENGGGALGAPEEFISEDSNNWADGWTPDSKSILFSSDRNSGIRNLFQQAVANGSPESIAPSGDYQESGVEASDGKSLLFWSWPKQEGDYPKQTALWQLSLPGGLPAELLSGKPSESDLRCALAAPVCVVSDESKKGLNFSRLDIQSHRQEFIASMNLQVADRYDWDISPDGRMVAAVHSDMSDNVVWLMRLSNSDQRQIPVAGWAELDKISWSADGTGFFVSSNLPKRSGLLHVDLKGKADVLWHSESADNLGKALPSPDGKFIAFTVGTANTSNAWMIELF